MVRRKQNTQKQASNTIVTVHNAQEFISASKKLKSEGFIPLPKTITHGVSSAKGMTDYMQTVVSMLSVDSGDDGALESSSVPLVFAQTGNENMYKNSKNIGTDNLGWMEWGANNRLPNVISLLTGMLPYTSVPHKFNTDLLAGMGPQPMYAYSRYIGGNITKIEIPYADAGMLLQGQISELLQQCKTIEEDHPGLLLKETTEEELKSSTGLLYQQLKARINKLKDDYNEWEKTNKEIRTFQENNGLALTSLQLASDFTLLGICFPELQLNANSVDENGKVVKPNLWKPKVTGIMYRPAHICRLERMDKDWRSNYVYMSNSWLNDPYLSTSSNPEKTGDVYDVDALPAVRVDKGVQDIEELVRNARTNNLKAKDRPTRIIMPIYYPTPGCPYYPKPAWHSIFAGDIYEYAATIISDRLTRKRNSNVVGRIIYLDQGYINSLYSQKGAQTDDERDNIMESLFQSINSYLSNRDNSGSSLLAYTYVGPDGKEHESFKIVEIERNNKNDAEANQKELQEISSIISFGWSLDARLIGNTPGTESSSGGTDLRERYTVKQVQMAPSTQLFLRPYEVASAINDWDREHLVWRIKRLALTTLDNSKTGVTEAKETA